MTDAFSPASRLRHLHSAAFSSFLRATVLALLSGGAAAATNWTTIIPPSSDGHGAYIDFGSTVAVAPGLVRYRLKETNGDGSYFVATLESNCAKHEMRVVSREDFAADGHSTGHTDELESQFVRGDQGIEYVFYGRRICTLPVQGVDAPGATQEDAGTAYQPMTFEDFELDKKQMKVGTRVDLAGFYRKDGDLESLGSEFRGRDAEPTFSVGLLTDSASREARKRLLNVRALGGGVCEIGMCQVRILGRVVPCVVTQLGQRVKETVCVAMEDVRAVTQSGPESKLDRDRASLRSLLFPIAQLPTPGADVPAVVRFVVQIGVYADANQARETRLKVEQLGMRTYTQIAMTPDGSRIRLRVGPFTLAR